MTGFPFEDPEQIFAAAADHHRAGRLAEAIAGYRRSLGLKPDNAAALTALGIALHATDAYDEAVALLRRAVAVDPRSYDAHYNVGVVLDRQRRSAEAIDSYRAALAINPRAAAAWINLGLLLKESRRAEAIDCFRRAVAADPQFAPAHANLGNALFDAGARDEALAALRQAVSLAPSAARFHVILGQKLEATGDLAGAEAALRHALALASGQVDALALLPIVLQKLGRRDDAAALLDYERLLRVRVYDRMEGWPDLASFNAALVAYIRAHPTLQRDPPGRATQIGSQTLELFRDDDAPLAALRDAIAAAVGEYMASVVPTVPHAFSPHAQRWGINGWAVVLRSGGFQTAHYHPAGLISGIYYAQVPDDIARDAGEAGHIRFGEGLTDFPELLPPTHLTRSLKPKEGLLVLFPSFYWHRTIPFASGTDRICVAFDVVASA
jgi:tetratricopeptide (TPR) repeat protein